MLWSRPGPSFKYSGMPRQHRVHAPGSIMHLTARTQGKAHWFTDDIKTGIATVICDAARMRDTSPICFTVMSNHIHVVARTGSQPIGWFMQHVLQRTATLVKKCHGVQDHIFGKRYWAGICDDASYARQCIVYTHLNAFYAGLCAHPDEYRWSSHAYFASGRGNWSLDGFCELGNQLFSDSTTTDCQVNYRKFIDYWMARERLSLGQKFLFSDEQALRRAPTAHFGDELFQSEFSGDNHAPKSVIRMPTADCAVILLRRIAPGVALDDIRLAGRVHRLSAFRNELTAALLARGYRNGAIARCLCVSTSYVSAIAAEIRTTLIA